LSSDFSTNLGSKATADAKVDFDAARETRKIERNINLNKWLFISSEDFSALEKKHEMFSEGKCCPSSRVWQPSADSNGNLTIRRTFFNMNFLTWV
jgi:hypothetical protein